MVIGDVAGHGLPAPVVMGGVRSTVRAYALEDFPPDNVLGLVDRKVQHFEVDTMITLESAVSRPPYDQFQVVSAGHPPPILAQSDQPATIVNIDVRPPLGIGSGRQPAPTRLSLPPGGVLVLYTDGVVERRGEGLDVGLEHLRGGVG